jgi:hypothetical protein
MAKYSEFQIVIHPNGCSHCGHRIVAVSLKSFTNYYSPLSPYRTVRGVLKCGRPDMFFGGMFSYIKA